MILSSKKFDELYRQLNPEQREAVDTIEGPVMVVAGPGTGKTQILTLRIANILRKTDGEPDNILALTFTESGSYAMRRRLVEIIGSPAYRVAISTFHGFCNRVIQSYPEEFSRIIGSNNITEVDQIRILSEIVSSLPLKRLRPFGDELYYVRPLLSAINELKREDIDEEELDVFIKREERRFAAISDLTYQTGAHKGKMKAKYREEEKELKKNRELVFVYRTYQEELRKSKLYDYNDMIMEVIRQFEESPDLLLNFQEQYQYILADEHQDANNAQNKILYLLSGFHENPNLFIVGDEKQAIFRFQGASLENLLYFKKHYPDAKLITLSRNYRSTQTILDSADSLISKNTIKIAGRATNLEAVSKDERKKISWYEFSRPSHEYYFLAKDIGGKISGGILPSEIAIFYRDNRDVFPLARVFEKTAIPFVIESDQDILQDTDIKKLILLIRAIERFGDDEFLVPALHIDFLKIDPLDVYKIIRYAQEHHHSLFDVIRKKQTLDGLPLVFPDSIIDFYRKLSAWKIHSQNGGFLELFDDIVRDSGLLNHILTKPDAIDKMDKINSLFREIRIAVETHRDYTLRDFIEYLKMLEDHGVLMKRALAGIRPKSIRLMTAHKAKGLEFDCVYIINARDGHWGNRRIGKHFHLPFSSIAQDIFREARNNDDERRLFYVAITRARREVTISYARESEEGRDQMPSLFIAEIDPPFLEHKDGKPYEEEFEKNKDFMFAPQKSRGEDIKDREYLRELFMRRGFSVTALNNYLSCPWKYFYINLLRVPKSPTRHQMYGIAIHEALARFFNKIKVEENTTKALLLELFRSRLLKEPLLRGDFEALLQRGEKALSGYYDTYHTIWIPTVINEFNVGAIQLTPEIKLTGKMDKIEIVGSTNEVNVVDYKTAKPKSRNEIEGKTKISRGDYKRQLVFYRLLLDNYGDRKYRMVSGEIDFVEPNERGIYKKERFEIDDSEVKELEHVIKEVTGDIMNLAFWDMRCGEKDCEFCGLRSLME